MREPFNSDVPESNTENIEHTSSHNLKQAGSEEIVKDNPTKTENKSYQPEKTKSNNENPIQHKSSNAIDESSDISTPIEFSTQHPIPKTRLSDVNISIDQPINSSNDVPLESESDQKNLAPKQDTKEFSKSTSLAQEKIQKISDVKTSADPLTSSTKLGGSINTDQNKPINKVATASKRAPNDPRELRRKDSNESPEKENGSK